MASSVPGMFPIPISPDGPLSPAAGPFIGPVEIRGKKIKKYIFLCPSCLSPAGPFIGPVEIRGEKNKKKIFLFSLLSTGGLNLAPKG